MIPLMFQVCAYVEEDMLIYKSLPLRTTGAETFTSVRKEHEILGISVVVYTQWWRSSCSWCQVSVAVVCIEEQLHILSFIVFIVMYLQRNTCHKTSRLYSTVKTVNFVKSRPFILWIFTMLCKEKRSPHN